MPQYVGPQPKPIHNSQFSICLLWKSNFLSLKSETGNRESLLTFIGADMEAVRWKQWRMYFTGVQPTGIGPQRQPGIFSSSTRMAGYPKIYNIEMDPHEDLQVGALFGWTPGPMLEVVEKYKETLKKYPNPPASNLTKF